jgi:hypothetical protein
MNSPRTSWLTPATTIARQSWSSLVSILLLAGVATLTSCSVNSNGPVSVGASHGSLGSSNMSDYYYRKQAGWTYVFQNRDAVHNADGSVTIRSGANDTVRTLGYAGMTGPNGDSLFKVAITYRVLSTYAGRPEIDLLYLTNGHSSNGAFIDQSFGLSNEQSMYKRPRPVSTDTILAGVAGRIRTLCDDFAGSGAPVTWQTDTLWFTSHGDSVFIWERFPGMTTLSCSRLIFCRDFQTGTGNGWTYDMIYGSTYMRVKDVDDSYSTNAGTFNHTAQIEVLTPSVSDNMPITEYKWFACGVGEVAQTDQFYVSTNGYNRIEHDYSHYLVSLTH